MLKIYVALVGNSGKGIYVPQDDHNLPRRRDPFQYLRCAILDTHHLWQLSLNHLKSLGFSQLPAFPKFQFPVDSP